MCCVICFFVKQKAAYEKRISDWSSDVCASDLMATPRSSLSRRARYSDGEECDAYDEMETDRAGPCRYCGHRRCGPRRAVGDGAARPGRSEEHTSELQSLMRISYAVFCLKKKKNDTTTK